MQNRTYKSLTVFLVTLILLSTFTFLVSTSAQNKNLDDKAYLSLGVVDKASASLVFGEKNCSVKPLVFGSDKVFSEGRGQQNKVTLTSEKYNVLVEDIENGVEYVLVVKDKLERGFVEFELDTSSYSVTQDGSLLTELPKKEYVVWNETYAFDGQNITRKDISLVGCLRFIPNGQIMEEFIIKRPYIYDSLGTGVWGEQRLNGNVLTVTISKDFLEKAVYPIFIDPTIIFSDGFESNDFSAWTGTLTTGDSAISTNNISPYKGTYDAKAICVTDQKAVVYKDLGSLYNTIYLRSYLNWSSFVESGRMGVVMGVYQAAGGNLLAEVGIRSDGSNYRFFVDYRNGGATSANNYYNSVVPTTSTVYLLELKVVRADGSGEVKLYIDDSEVLSFSSLDNDEWETNTFVQVGAYGLGGGTSWSGNQTVNIDSVVVSASYIGPETSGPESLAVELGSPTNASTTTSYSQNFTYTPTIIGSDSIQNASLYIDNSLVASNATAITNATANTISFTFTSNGKYEWTIGVYNTTHLVFPYGNYTITVSVNEALTDAEESDYTTIILFVISIILCIVGLALTVPLLPLISLTISVLNIIFLSEPSIFNILLTLLNVTFTVIALVRAKTKNN